MTYVPVATGTRTVGLCWVNEPHCGGENVRRRESLKTLLRTKGRFVGFLILPLADVR